MCRSTRMAGPVAERSNRLPPYSGMAAASLRLGALVVLGLMASGCAMTGGLNGVFGKSKSDEVRASALAAEEATRSTAGAALRPRRARGGHPLHGFPGELCPQGRARALVAGPGLPHQGAWQAGCLG